MGFKAVIFDLFGTLVDYLGSDEYHKALDEIAGILGVDPKAFLEIWRKSFDKRMVGEFSDLAANYHEVGRRLGVRFTEEQVEETVRKRIDFTRLTLNPRDDSVSTLLALKEKGYKLGLISDCSMEVPVLWPELPFAKLMDVPLFSSTEGIRKPNPDIYLRACQRLGVKAEECLYVGDGSSDELAGAKRVGMTSVLIRTPYEDDSGKFRLSSRDWDGLRVSSLGEIPGLLEKLEKLS